MKTLYFITGFSFIIGIICLIMFFPEYKAPKTISISTNTNVNIQPTTVSKNKTVKAATVINYEGLLSPTTIVLNKEDETEGVPKTDFEVVIGAAKIAGKGVTGGVVSSTAYKAYRFSGATNEAELFKLFRSHRFTPSYSKKMSSVALTILKDKNFGAGTIAISTGALVYTAEQGLDIEIKYKIIIALAFSVIVFLLVRFIQGKKILE